MNSLLLRLKTDEFSDSIGFILPPVPMRRLLTHSADVRRIVSALAYGAITESDIREFVGDLQREFRPGELFRYDIALAALAVGMERWDNPIAEEYLRDLAKTDRPEIAASGRIARECLKSRYAFPQNHLETAIYPRKQHIPIPIMIYRAVAWPETNPDKLSRSRNLKYSEAIYGGH